MRSAGAYAARPVARSGYSTCRSAPSACSMSSRELPGNVNDALPAIEQQYPLSVIPTFAYPGVPAQDQLLDLVNLELAHTPYPHQSIRWHWPTRQAAPVKGNHLPRHRVESTRHPVTSTLLPRITGLGTGRCLRSPANTGNSLHQPLAQRWRWW